MHQSVQPGAVEDTPQKAFYKKDHRWKDGLASAAQAVGWGANMLVDSAEEALAHLHGQGSDDEGAFGGGSISFLRSRSMVLFCERSRHVYRLGRVR